MRDPSTCLVIDLESTCWEGIPPPNPESEIIEIGLTLIDVPRREIGEQRSIVVRPAREVSDFCTRLTGITQAEVDGGITLEAACQILRREYQSRNRQWASYGGYDERAWRRECVAKDLPYPFGVFHLDIKGLFELKTGEMKNLTEALAHLGMGFEGRAHRGVDDAFNTARLLLALL